MQQVDRNIIEEDGRHEVELVCFLMGAPSPYHNLDSKSKKTTSATFGLEAKIAPTIIIINISIY